MALKSEQELIELQTKYLCDKNHAGFGIFRAYTMPIVFGKHLQEIDEFEVHNDDTWVISGPKCGTTWTQEMVWCITNNFNMEGTTVRLETRFPFFDRDRVLEDRCMEGMEKQDMTTRPRFLKSHLPWSLLPKQLREFEKKPKIIYVARNPKDICISYFHHHELFNNYKGGFDVFWQLFVSAKVHYMPIIDNMLSYWERRNDENVLFLKYEDMKRNLPDVIRQVAQFLGVEATEDNVAMLSKHLSFEEMRNNPATNKQHVVEWAKKCGMCVNPEGNFIRRGVAGAYKTEMNPEVIKYFDEWMEKGLAGTGLIFE